MSETSNILINNTVDVIEIHSNTDLTLETHTQIKFNTNNLLVNYIPFDEYIRKVVFDESITTSLTNEVDVHSAYGETGLSSGTIDLTNNTSEMEIDELYSSGINTNSSYVDTNIIHYINISASSRIVLNNILNSTNIVYNKLDEGEYSFSNYIYKIVNTPSTFVANTLIAGIHDSGQHDISYLGTYVGRKIISSNLSTSNIQIDDGSGVLYEPILNINSATGINLFTYAYDTVGSVDAGSNIFLGNLSLDAYVKSQLDENPRDGISQVFYFNVNILNGETITMNYIEAQNGGFSNALFGNTFEYSILYNIYNETDFVTPPSDIGTLTPLSSNLDVSVIQDIHDTTDFIFDNLTSGNFYRIYANVTNLKTGTVINNVGPIETNIATIPHVTNITFTIISDNQMTFNFTPHAINISGFARVYYKMGLIIKDSTPIETVVVDELEQPNPSSTLDDLEPPNQSFYFPFSSLLETTYEQGYIKNEDHTFKIISYHLSPGTFSMSSSEISVSNFGTLFTGLPNPPSTSGGNITNSGSNYNFSFNIPTQSMYTSGLSYELYYNGTFIGTTTNSPLTLGTLLSFTSNFVILSGTYSISTVNVYGNKSARATFFTLNNLSVSGHTYSADGDTTFTITWTVNNSVNGFTSYMNNTSIGQVITYNTLALNISPSGHSFIILVTDNLGRSATQTVTISPVSVTASLSHLIFHAKPRIYKTTISSTQSTQNNGGLNSVSSQYINNSGTHSDTYTNTTSTQYFQLPNFTESSKSFSFGMQVKDNWGYSSGSISKSTQITPIFGTILGRTISYNDIGRQFLLTVSSSTVTDTFSHQWTLDGINIDGETSNVTTLTDSQIGDLGCKITQTNSYGFFKYHVQESVFNITYATINVSTFTIESTSTYNVVYTVSNSGSAVLYVSTNSSSNTNTTTFVAGTTYYLWGNSTNQYGFLSPTTYLSRSILYSIPPTFVSNISYSKSRKNGNEITLEFNVGDNGTPSLTLSEIRVYYLKDPNDIDNYHIFYSAGQLDDFEYILLSSPTISGNIYTYNFITFPENNTAYKIRVVKVYDTSLIILSFEQPEIDTLDPIPGPVQNLSLSVSASKLKYTFNAPSKMFGYIYSNLYYTIKLLKSDDTLIDTFIVQDSDIDIVGYITDKLIQSNSYYVEVSVSKDAVEYLHKTSSSIVTFTIIMPNPPVRLLLSQEKDSSGNFLLGLVLSFERPINLNGFTYDEVFYKIQIYNVDVVFNSNVEKVYEIDNVQHLNGGPSGKTRVLNIQPENLIAGLLYLSEGRYKFTVYPRVSGVSYSESYKQVSNVHVYPKLPEKAAVSFINNTLNITENNNNGVGISAFKLYVKTLYISNAYVYHSTSSSTSDLKNGFSVIANTKYQFLVEKTTIFGNVMSDESTVGTSYTLPLNLDTSYHIFSYDSSNNKQYICIIADNSNSPTHGVHSDFLVPSFASVKANASTFQFKKYDDTNVYPFEGHHWSSSSVYLAIELQSPSDDRKYLLQKIGGTELYLEGETLTTHFYDTIKTKPRNWLVMHRTFNPNTIYYPNNGSSEEYYKFATPNPTDYKYISFDEDTTLFEIKLLSSMDDQKFYIELP